MDSANDETMRGTDDDQDRRLAYGDRTYVHDDVGRIAEMSDANGTTELAHDAFGNLAVQPRRYLIEDARPHADQSAASASSDAWTRNARRASMPSLSP